MEKELSNLSSKEKLPSQSRTVFIRDTMLRLLFKPVTTVLLVTRYLND